MSDDAKPIARQDMLLKLLKMTTSDNDGEALTAIRHANRVLRDAGWDWDKLIHAKIRIVEDPFKNLGTPSSSPSPMAATSHAPYAPPPRAPSPPPPQRLRGTPAAPISSAPNRFADSCWCCGIEVVALAGWIFKPAPSHTKYEDVCATCNTSATVYNSRAPRAKPAKGKRSVIDLA